LNTSINTKQEKIYIIQPITNENALKYRVLQEEAVALIESANAVYVGTIYQTVREINSATYIGSGKLLELKERLDGLEDVTILFNGDLSPSQALNISAILDDRKVIDRTTLILDIFAQNAKTSEGKLQVELAQLKYMYPRLKGKGSALSKLGGGVGTRGPGETQLETDRRYIRLRLQYLRARLAEIEKRRELQTRRRKKNDIKTIALIGYTNTGKSTLLNALTDADTYVKNALFATLDPTARKFSVEGIEMLLIDTVGFLQELPHHLVEAFKSTLESALNCDLALIVCDATGEYDMQLKTTLETLEEMQFSAPYLVVMNKSENIKDYSAFPYESIPISAKNGVGLENLKRKIFAHFQKEFFTRTLFIPYEHLKEYSKLKNYLTERSSEYNDDGLWVVAHIPEKFINYFEQYIQSEND